MEKNFITNAEWEVMRVVWSEKSTTSRHIITTLCSILQWKEGTIKSLINRLVQKGYLEPDLNQKTALYSPTISQLEASKNLLDATMSKNCTKDRGKLLAYLLDSQTFSQEDCDTLIHILKKKARSAPKEIACQCQKGQCTCHLHPHN